MAPHYDIQQNDIQNNDIQHNDTKHYDIQQNNKWNVTLSITAYWQSIVMLSVTCKYNMLSVVMQECRYADFRGNIKISGE